MGNTESQCKTWEFLATSCSRHPDLFIYPIFLMQESLVFIEIIFSHGDVYDSNIKILW